MTVRKSRDTLCVEQLPLIKSCGIFEGQGGFPLAAQFVGGFDWQCSIDNDLDAIAVLRSNFDHQILHQDIRGFVPARGQFDLICGGFPCNGTSRAGKRNGLQHPKSALFREFLRIICQARPALICLEQPLGFEHRGLRAWVGGLAMAGYQSLDPICTSADELGANFRRERLFIISYSTEWARSKRPPFGNYQVREAIERVRGGATGLSVERSSDGCIARIPSGLVQGNIPDASVPSRYPGRLRARLLAGQTVTISQARVALTLVREIWRKNMR